ncbi:MAG TPA: sortase [Chloroflexi bacterium]|nr:sortase [Chloroflexota bacterium]
MNRNFARVGAVLSMRNEFAGKLGIVVTLLGLLMGVAGCGRSASAEMLAAQAAPKPGSYIDMTDVVKRPAAPWKAPVFHQPDAKPVLPSRLLIPAIQADMPVIELGWSTKKDANGAIFSEWDVADYAAGWHKNSSLPGEPGNIVLSGHNNIKGAVFRELDQLKRGDEIQLMAGGIEYSFTVDEVLIVPEKYASAEQRAANVRYIQETADDRLTLVSCWPRNDNTHRIIVIARPTGTLSQNGGATVSR